MNLQILKPIETAGGGNARPHNTSHPWPHIIHHAWRLAWLLALLSLPWRALAAETTTSLLQKGLFEEEANQNLEAAIQNYQLVISQADEERKLAATAVFRLGECYRKKGLTNEAVAQYQRLIRDYSDQATLAKLSQQNLAGLGLGSVTLPNGAAIIGPAEFQQRVLTLLENVQTNVTKKKVREDIVDLSLPKVDEEAEEIERLAKIIKDSPDLINGTAEKNVPLINAAGKGWIKVVRYLLENKADPNAVVAEADANNRRSYTALYTAVLKNNTEMVKLLLSYHADPDKGDRLPLCWAAEYGDLDIAELLIKAKADVNNLDDLSECAPLHLAVKNGHKSMAELLFRSGADLNIRNKGTRQGLEQNPSPLHFAVKYNRIALLEWLCVNKAAVNIRTINEVSPLLLAVQSGNQEAVALLLKFHAEVNPQGQELHGGQFTPLLAAINKKSIPLAKLLLENGANPNGNQIPGREPSWQTYAVNAAIDTALDEMVELLITNKAQVDIPNFPPLMYAINQGKESIVKLLLEAKCQVNTEAVVDGAMYTPLTLAVHRNLKQTTAWLIESGANTDVLCGAGCAPLHIAVMNENTNLVALLAEKANPNVLDTLTQTPLDMVLSRIDELQNQTSTKKQARSASRSSRPGVRRLPIAGAIPPRIEPPVDFPAPIPVNFVSAPIEQLRTQASLSDCQEMARILRAHGALEEFSRMLFIQAQYADDAPLRVFQKDKAGINQFTLLEVLSYCPGYLTDLNTPFYPDWMKVTVRRWDPQAKQETLIECPLPKTEEEAAAWKDVPLQWGDIVCISERVYSAADRAQFKWEGAMQKLLKQSQRKIGLTIRGERFNLGIPLRMDTGTWGSGGTPIAGKYDESNRKSPWLLSAIYDSNKLLNTSDITRVKVVRKQGEASHEWVFDLSQVKFPDDLWLQDGDEIFVPDREK